MNLDKLGYGWWVGSRLESIFHTDSAVLSQMAPF